MLVLGHIRILKALQLTNLVGSGWAWSVKGKKSKIPAQEEEGRERDQRRLDTQKLEGI